MNSNFSTDGHARRVCALILCTLCMTAAAKDPPRFSPTDPELKLLPEACTVRLRGDPSTWAPWVRKLGRDTYMHFHHHCFGLNFINRAQLNFDKKDKRYNLERAIANFDYVLRHYPADSPLRPEAEAGKRQAQMMMQLL